MSVQFYRGPDSEELGRDLAEASGFLSKDLYRNQRGRITGRQMAMLLVKTIQPMWAATAALAGWGLLLGICTLLLPGLVRWFVLKKIGGVTLGITVGVVGNFLLCFLQFSRRIILLQCDLVLRRADSIDGRVAPSWEEMDAAGLGKFRGDKIAVYKYCIRDHSFEVGRAAYELLLTKYGDFRPQVRIHYARYSRMMLSVEPMDPSQKPQ